MPTYDYICHTCGSQAEVTCKMSERDERVPECAEHGDMCRTISNNQKHTDNTQTRKGYYNSHENNWR